MRRKLVMAIAAGMAGTIGSIGPAAAGTGEWAPTCVTFSENSELTVDGTASVPLGGNRCVYTPLNIDPDDLPKPIHRLN